MIIPLSERKLAGLFEIQLREFAPHIDEGSVTTTGGFVAMDLVSPQRAFSRTPPKSGSRKSHVRKHFASQRRIQAIFDTKTGLVWLRFYYFVNYLFFAFSECQCYLYEFNPLWNAVVWSLECEG